MEGEVFEVLSTFTNFMAFKEMFLDYRAVSNITYIKMNVSIIISNNFQIKEGKVEDLSNGIFVTSFKPSNINDKESFR